MDGARLRSATLKGGETIEADWFVAALPLEVMHGLISDEVAKAAPGLARFRTIDPAWMTSWMVGAQYWLKTDRPIVRGHMFFPDSEWALTAISQAQFWKQSGPAYEDRYGDGAVHGVLSVDISDWFEPSRHTGLKAAETTTREEVLDEIWRHQGRAQRPGELVVRDEDVLHRYLDSGIVFGWGARPINKTLLLNHPPGSHGYRPPPATAIDNLLALDYAQPRRTSPAWRGPTRPLGGP